jgi:hypothetical protein
MGSRVTRAEVWRVGRISAPTMAEVCWATSYALGC